MKASDIAELQRKLAQLKMEQENINYGPPADQDEQEEQDGELDGEHYEGHDQDDEEQDEQPMMHHQQQQHQQYQNYQSNNGGNMNKHGYTGQNFHQNQMQNQQMMEDNVRRLEKSPSQPLQQVLQQRAPLFENGRVNFRNRQFRIEDFEIFTTLGTGTFGRVRQVKIKGDPNKAVYALKMMKKTEIVRLNQVEHIRSETRLLQAIRHPFFVDMKTYFQDEKYVYMLFEYVSGGEMFSRLRKEGRFSNDVALFYISEILLAIEYLHRQEIVYRDLKPENLLLHRDGHIKITDFGFAKKLTNDRTYTLCGTPEYLAPEIIKGAKVGYGKSVDWWALGVLIFEMLAGYPPFYDNEPIGIYKKIIVGIIEFPQFLSLRSKDIIRKLLNPDYNRRLGVKECGDDVKRHKWFRGVDWDALYRKEIPPPWQPPLKNEEDSTWFDKYPDSKEPAKPLPRELTHLFKDL